MPRKTTYRVGACTDSGAGEKALDSRSNGKSRCSLDGFAKPYCTVMERIMIAVTRQGSMRPARMNTLQNESTVDSGVSPDACINSLLAGIAMAATRRMRVSNVACLGLENDRVPELHQTQASKTSARDVVWIVERTARHSERQLRLMMFRSRTRRQIFAADLPPAMNARIPPSPPHGLQASLFRLARSVSSFILGRGNVLCPEPVVLGFTILLHPPASGPISVE